MRRTTSAILLLTAALPGRPAGAAVPCEPIPGAGALLRPGGIVLLGELHGTVEAPRVLAELACDALAAGHPVLVGLELPRAAQEELDAFMAGSGTTRERERLLAGEFWQRDYQDGRTSLAMLELHSVLRNLAAASGRLEVVYIDEPSQRGARDRAMAERVLAERAEAPDSIVIVLTGNLHNRLARGTAWNSEYEPMGFLITQRAPAARIASLQLTNGPGSAWICQGVRTSDCGVTDLQGRPSSGDGVVSPEDPTEAAVTGRLHLGPITASPPAKSASRPPA